MSSNIVLLTPARRFIANRAGIGYQIPLGLVLVGGPLVDPRNFAADREAAREVIEAIARSGLRVSINLNMTAADVVRDRDLMSLYKRAGVDNIVLGIESLEDGSVERIPKDNSFAVSRKAVAVLRRNRIVSLVNIMYGLAEETTGTLRQTFRRLLALDPDVLNAVYLTPHHWTRLGRETRPEHVIQPDLARFTYRNPVLATPHLSPSRLFWSVKCTEALFHLRPRSLVRMLLARDRRFRKVLRSYLVAGVGVVLAEIVEHLGTELVPPGTLTEVPGYPRAAREALRVLGS